MPIKIDHLAVNFSGAEGSGGTAKKKSKTAGGDPTAAVPSGLASGGAPLGEKAARFAEGIFGRRFDDVRIHGGTEGARQSKALDADAFTIGSHIYFDFGKFDPETKAGQALLAHELTHVVQGTTKPAAKAAKGGDPVGAAGAERQAEAVEEAVKRGTPMPAIGHITPGPMVLRKAKPGSARVEGRHDLLVPDRPVRMGAGSRARTIAAKSGMSSPERPPLHVARDYDIVGFTEVAYGAVTRSWGDETGPDGAYTSTSSVVEGSGENYDVIRVWALRRKRGAGVMNLKPARLMKGLDGPIALKVLTGRDDEGRGLSRRSPRPILQNEAERSIAQGRARAKSVVNDIFNEILTDKLSHAISYTDVPEAAPLPDFGIEHDFRPQQTIGGGKSFLGGILSALKAGLAFASKLFGQGAGTDFAAQSTAAVTQGEGLAGAISNAIEGFKSGGLKGGGEKLGAVGKAGESFLGTAKNLGKLFSSPRAGAADLGPQSLEYQAQANERRAEAELSRAGPSRASALVPTADGERLAGPAREYAEKFFGRSMTDVRIHRDASAFRAADEFQAHAFTTGNNVYFGRGEFRPETPKGMALLIHELTHVVQQGEVGAVSRKAAPGAQLAGFGALDLGTKKSGGWPAPGPIEKHIQPVVHEQRVAQSVTALPGLPIQADVRAKLEETIDADLARVRLFTGSKAQTAAKDLDADAFAHGDNIVLGEKAASDLAAGKTDTLAHELEHVRQVQRGDNLGAKTPLAREVLEESARRVEKELKTFGPAMGIASFLRSPETINRVAGGLPDELALLLKPTKQKIEPPKPEEKEGPEEEEQIDDSEHVIPWAMQYFGIRPQVTEEEFLDEIAERIRDLMEEELRMERERRHVEAPF